MYYCGSYKVFSNVRKRNNPFNRRKGSKMAFFILPSRNENFSISKKRINTFTYYIYKYFRPCYRQRIAFCTDCQNKFKAIVKRDQVVTACPNCEE